MSDYGKAAPAPHGVLLSWAPGVLREVTTEFTVDARSLTATGGNHVTARVLNPSGAKTDTYVTDNGDGTYRVQYTAYEEGEGLAECRRVGSGSPRSGQVRCWGAAHPLTRSVWPASRRASGGGAVR